MIARRQPRRKSLARKKIWVSRLTAKQFSLRRNLHARRLNCGIALVKLNWWRPLHEAMLSLILTRMESKEKIIKLCDFHNRNVNLLDLFFLEATSVESLQKLFLARKLHRLGDTNNGQLVTTQTLNLYLKRKMIIHCWNSLNRSCPQMNLTQLATIGNAITLIASEQLLGLEAFYIEVN